MRPAPTESLGAPSRQYFARNGPDPWLFDLVTDIVPDVTAAPPTRRIAMQPRAIPESGPPDESGWRC